jgi:hypothetical protein
MSEFKPYRQDVSARRKKALSIASLAILAVAAAGLAAWYVHSRGSGRDTYSGKVVQISGSIQDVGLVKKFREGRSITYYSAASGFKDLVFHRIEGADSFRIIADSAAAFLKMTEGEGQAPAGAAAAPAEEPGPDDSWPPPMDVVPGDDEPQELPGLREQGGDDTEKPVLAADEPAREGGTGDLGYSRKREEGLWEYDRIVGELAAKADQIDSLWDKYANFCRGTIAVAAGHVHGREWFGIYSTINAADTPECRMMINDMQALASEIDAGMEAAWEQAHRSGVYPGQIRAVQQKFRMELDRWNK